jgi:DNA-binding GntR family transcriptional regulator
MSQTQQSDLALERLRRDLLSGALAPGSAVSETGIAGRYATGRASARTALQRLTQQGLVAVVPRRGYVIARVTIGDVREIFQMRLALEPLAARLAAGRVDARTMLARERKALAAWRGRRSTGADVLAHNRFVHMHIAEASGNARLVRQIDDLLAESERSVMIGLGNGSLVTQMMDEHLPLIEALQSGDPDVAEERARRHVETTMRNTMDGFLSTDAVLSQAIHALRT